MMVNAGEHTRTLGFWGATAVGVGAIVGGGILALSGVAFNVTGPSAILAFTLNGLIAFATATTFAEMSSAFPESGGTYIFSKKILSVDAAFLVGWIVWCASIVAGVLYAIGFASFFLPVVEAGWPGAPAWLLGRTGVTGITIGAVLFYGVVLSVKTGGGGQIATLGKVVVFAVLIGGGLFILFLRSLDHAPLAHMRPFFPHGAAGVFSAMGYTFIALQGFDLIAAVGGEVRDPERNIPKAMFWSLGIALLVYLPLLLIICTIGIPAGSSLADLSRMHPETVVAEAARTYLGPFGFWLVIVAGLLSMLSALSANLFAASRVALSMAQDRSLPAPFGIISDKRGTPTNAVVASVVTMMVIVIVLGDVAMAGAASSLIFLMTFAVAHWICILMRRRGGAAFARFRLKGTQCLPYVGGIACVGLAVFQGVAVPPAGIITGMWLLAGAALFFLILSRRARVVDASAIAMDPQLLRLRGRSPLVLVPIANPANAQAMVIVANALTPPGMGRVLLLSVVAVPDVSTPEGVSHGIDQAQQVLQASLSASVIAGLRPEALTTVANDIWEEIARVARVHHCEILLLGFSAVSERLMATHVETLISSVRSDVAVLRSSPGWHLDHVERVLVPVGGRSSHRQLRARLLSSLYRSAPRQITYLRVVPEETSQRAFDNILRELQRFAQDEVHAVSEALVIRSNDPLQTIIEHAKQSHLILLGLQRPGIEQRLFGNLPLTVAEQSDCAIIMIHQKATRRAERHT